LSSWRNDPEKYERKKLQGRKWHQRHKKRTRERHRIWAKLHPHKITKWRFEHKWKHYLTFEQYKLLCNLQNNKCAICKRIPKRSLAVDHNHKTNEFRGLLCFHCNAALSHVNDSQEVLRRMIWYLSGK